jgi:hypothetical protein
MGVLTDFFLASESDLKRVLSGWQLPPPPLDAPITFQAQNPFTKAPVTVRTRCDRERMPSPAHDADPSPDISSLPRVQCKGLLPDKLAIIFARLSNIPFDDAFDLVMCGTLVGPPETEISVSRIPASFVASVASASREALASAAQAVEDEEVAESGDGMRGIASGLTDVLLEVHGLVRSASARDAGLYLWVCP